MSHPFTYVELHTDDPAAASAFYRHLFDWQVKESATPAGPYVALEPGEGMSGGLRRAASGPSRWVVYVRVADVAAATERAIALGARALVTRQEVPNLGWFSLCVDPAGATFGLWQAMAAREP
ncbi:MAG TPA: VOC family protein [Candidatus Acidoferrum sp.]|nr:VOC family protein [Candidatus Acidoferrum sp.]